MCKKAPAHEADEGGRKLCALVSRERDSLALSLSPLNNILIFLLMYLLVPGWIITNRLFHFRPAWRANNNSVEKHTKLSSCIEVSVL